MTASRSARSQVSGQRAARRIALRATPPTTQGGLAPLKWFPLPVLTCYTLPTVHLAAVPAPFLLEPCYPGATPPCGCGPGASLSGKKSGCCACRKTLRPTKVPCLRWQEIRCVRVGAELCGWGACIGMVLQSCEVHHVVAEAV